MGMSTHVFGVRQPDEKWLSMKRVWDVCTEAGVVLPEEVEKFFNGEPPDQTGITIDLEKYECVANFKTSYQIGFEVEIAKLPENITHIRFYNAW